MAYLVDTSVLARLVNLDDVAYPAASHAIAELHRRDEVLHVTAQILVEFRNVATRRRTEAASAASIWQRVVRAQAVGQQQAVDGNGGLL